MTDREKLIELLESAESAFYWNSDDKTFIQKIADHLIANGVVISKNETTTQRWIPVTERLPRGAAGGSFCENVIARLNNGEYDCVCTGWLNGDWWYLLFDDDDYYTKWKKEDVTHWMTLPEIPKEE